MREPIWSNEAEQSLIGGALLDQRCLGGIAVRPDEFRHPAHRLIWAEILAIDAKRQPVDVVTVGVALRDKVDDAMSYLNTLAASVPSASNARRYAEIVKDRAVRRALVDAADKAADMAAEDVPLSEVLERVSSSITALHVGQVRNVPRRLSEIARQRADHYTALAEGSVPLGWPSTIASLNATLSGGFRPGKVVFIGARPGIGKSSLSAQILLEQAAAGRPGLFLSQEMGAEEVADRAIANRGRIDFGRILSGNLSDSDWSRASDMLDQMAELPVWVDDQPALSLADIRHKVRAVPGVKFVVLDYLQLCSRGSTSSASNRNSEIEEISRGLKALAMELGLCVIVLSQLNREVEKRPGKRPVLSDLRDSGSIEQDADVILLLWPVRDLEQGGKLIGMEVAKNRQGRAGVEIAMDFRGHHQRWAESTESVRVTATNSRYQGGFNDE